MKARYDLRKNPKRKGETGDETLHPRLVSSGTISAERLFSEKSEISSLSEHDLEAALTALADRAGYYISQGYMVEFGKMGHFTGSLKATHEIKEKKDIRSVSVFFDGVNFKVSKWFKRRSAGTLERAKKGFKDSVDIGRDERIRRLMRHLDEYIFISRKEYCAITGLLKNKALAELHELVKEGLLKTRGMGNQLVFMKRN